MKKNIWVLVVLLILACQVSEDVNPVDSPFLLKYFGSYGGDESANTVIEHDDSGGYLIGGSISNIEDENNTLDALIILVDENGNRMKTYSSSNSQVDDEVTGLVNFEGIIGACIYASASTQDYIDLLLLSENTNTLDTIGVSRIAERNSGGLEVGGLLIEQNMLYVQYILKQVLQDSIKVVRYNLSGLDASTSGTFRMDDIQQEEVVSRRFIGQTIQLAGTIKKDRNSNILYTGVQQSNSGVIRQFFSRILTNGLEETVDFGQPQTGESRLLNEFEVTKSNQYLITGTSRSAGAINTNIYFSKLNVDSESKVFLTDTVYTFGSSSEQGIGIIQTNDLGYVLIFNTFSDLSNTTLEDIASMARPGGNDIGLMKLDGSGAIQQIRLIGSSGSEVAAKSIIDSKGKVIVVGEAENAGNSNIFLIRIDEKLNLY